MGGRGGGRRRDVLKDKKKQAQIKRIYYNPASPGSFGGVSRLHRQLSKKFTRQEIAAWLRTQDVYTLHKPVRKQFKRNRILVSQIDDVWQLDLVDMQSHKRDNQSYAYLLTCIDVFSKYAWTRPIKSKSAHEIINAFDDILKDGRKPRKIHTDRGTEFLNWQFQSFLKEKSIGFYVTFSETKAAVVERFNRTLKTRMWQYFTHTGSYRYIDVIQQLVEGYNNSFHRSIGIAPNKVNAGNSNLIFKRLFPPHKQAPHKLSINDQVRISKTKRHFDKGYLPNWTHEVFTVSEKVSRTPPVYKIKDINGEQIDGTFYAEELQKIEKSDDDLWRIDRIVARRGAGNNEQVLVKWKGYSDAHNSWISASEVISLENAG